MAERGVRIPALDGVRAIAVLAVVGTHMQLRVARGGGYGVDIFFVLSGFLITSILLREQKQTGRISRRNFYARRALRLLPALGVVIVVTVPLDLTAKAGGGHLATALPAVVFYYGNWLVSANSQLLGFFGQTWSLAIEEQFYMLWPLVLLAAPVRRSMHRWLPPAIVAVVALRIIGVAAVGPQLTLWTPLHADGLLLGALVAVLATRETLPSWLSHPSAPWLAAAVATPFLVFGIRSEVEGAAVVAVISGCAAVVVAHLALRDDTTAARVLAWRPLVAVGRVSYGIYLYHYAILLWLFGHGYSRPVIWTVGLAVTAVLTVASWFLVERPALRVKRRFETVRSLRSRSSPSPAHPSPSGG